MGHRNRDGLAHRRGGVAVGNFKDTISSAASSALQAVGKGPGFVAVGVLEVILAFVLAVQAKDLSGFVAALGVVNTALYGAGAFKAHSDNKFAASNGNGNGTLANG